MAGDAEQLSIVVERDGDRMMVRLHGEVDIATTPMLADRLNQMNGDDIVVDLAGLTFLDASGLGALADAGKRAERRGNRLEIINADSLTQRMFELTALDYLLAGSDAI
jgi:anti-sigma B factor antagonist